MLTRPSLLSVLAVVLCPATVLPAEKPNSVLVVADDLGNADRGYRGSQVKTPHIDALVRGGARLESYHGNVVGEVDYFTHERGGVIDWQRNGHFLREKGDQVDLIEGHDASKPMFRARWCGGSPPKIPRVPLFSC